MKKKVFFAAAGLMVCTVAFTGYKVYSYATMTDQERLLLQNIEALTQNEEQEIKWGKEAKTRKIFLGKDANGTPVYFQYECCNPVESQNTGCKGILEDCPTNEE